MPTSTKPPSRHARERETWLARAQVFQHVLAGLVLLVSAVVLLGWLTDTARLVQVTSESQSMKLNTAVCFGLLAGAYLLKEGSWRRALLVGVLGLAAVILAQYAFGVSFGIDELVADDDVAPHPRFHGRPSETTLIAVMLLAVGGLLTGMRLRKAAEVVLMVPALFGMTALWGYFYGVEAMYQIGPYSSMALHTSLCLVLLSLAGLMAVPHGTLPWIAFGRDPGALIQRVLIPLALVVLPLGGWLRVNGELEGYYETSFGTALMVAFMALMVIVVGLVAGLIARRTDSERDALVDELHRVNQELEDRVRSRSMQLNRQRTKLALLEERDRIARDLHDRVIQRIFAAGLQVGALSRTARNQATADGAGDARLGDSLHAVATELDLAIRELRNSIFELTSIADHDDIEQVVRDIVSRASRILGFMPKIDVGGEIAGLSADLVANIASVLQEALSNIARHAQASEAEVAFHATETDIELRVTDDGVGMPDPLPRSSGVSNLLNRARTLGGSATWTGREPHGTVLVWRVPRDDESLQLTRPEGDRISVVDGVRRTTADGAEVSVASQG